MSDDGYATPDEAEAYARGYARAQRNHELADRAAAFGAIRRAAELARNYDACADRESPYYLDQLSAAVNVERASVIRAAIRAAIGSDKA